MSSTTGGGERSAAVADEKERTVFDDATGFGEIALGVIGMREALVGVALVGVMEPSGQPPSMLRAERADGETIFGDSGPLARVMAGDSGVLGTVSLKLGLRAESGRDDDAVAEDEGGFGVGGE